MENGQQKAVKREGRVAKKLEVLDEYPFTFYGDTFSIALASDRRLYLPLPLICKPLGIDSTGQAQRIRRDPTLADSLEKTGQHNHCLGHGARLVSGNHSQ